MNTLLTQSTAALVLAVTWVIAVQHVFHAKELPGEGFTAGALMLLALLLLYLVQGYEKARQSFPPRLFLRGLVVGGLIFVLLAFGPVLVGRSALETFEVSLLGMTLESMLLFDIGLFLVTVCSLLLAVHSMRGTLP
ncbi:MAG: MnhB domain-containing protein [Myxococcota bacterium]